jgi:hypothetical protein
MNDNSYNKTLEDYSKIVDKDDEEKKVEENVAFKETNHESHKFIRRKGKNLFIVILDDTKEHFFCIHSCLPRAFILLLSCKDKSFF